MATYQPAKKNTAWIGYISLVSQASTLVMKSNPTIAAGDFKVSIDGGALANLTTLPTVTPASSVMVKISLSSSEMNGDNITVVCSDAAGAEWCDLVFNIQTAARQIDDLAYPATSGRSMVVDASGLVDANTVKIGPTGSGTAQTAKDVGGAVPAAAAGASGGLLISGSNSGTTTLAALTVTGSLTISDGLLVSRSTGNTSAIVATGNGTGHGVLATSGSGVTGDGFKAVAASTNGNGITAAKTGSGNDLNATSTPLTLAKTTNITGFNDIAATAVVSSGAITTSGGAVTTVTTTTNLTNLPTIPANWLTAAGTAADFGAEMATAIWTDTTAGDFTVAASIGKTIVNGVSLGTGLTINAYTGNTAQTGDSFARLGAPAGASVSADIATKATPAQILTTALTESYAADGAAGTLSQLILGRQAFLQERAVSGTTCTVKKLDGSTTAMTFTLSDATSPVSITRAT